MDVFRKEYRPLTEDEIAIMNDIKKYAQDLYNFMDGVINPSDPRAMALAKTNLEQSVMWAVAVTG